MSLFNKMRTVALLICLSVACAVLSQTPVGKPVVTRRKNSDGTTTVITKTTKPDGSQTTKEVTEYTVISYLDSALKGKKRGTKKVPAQTSPKDVKRIIHAVINGAKDFKPRENKRRNPRRTSNKDKKEDAKESLAAKIKRIRRILKKKAAGLRTRQNKAKKAKKGKALNKTLSALKKAYQKRTRGLRRKLDQLLHQRRVKLMRKYQKLIAKRRAKRDQAVSKVKKTAKPKDVIKAVKPHYDSCKKDTKNWRIALRKLKESEAQYQIKNIPRVIAKMDKDLKKRNRHFKKTKKGTARSDAISQNNLKFEEDVYHLRTKLKNYISQEIARLNRLLKTKPEDFKKLIQEIKKSKKGKAEKNAINAHTKNHKKEIKDLKKKRRDLQKKRRNLNIQRYLYLIRSAKRSRDAKIAHEKRNKRGKAQANAIKAHQNEFEKRTKVPKRKLNRLRKRHQRIKAIRTLTKALADKKNDLKKKRRQAKKVKKGGALKKALKTLKRNYIRRAKKQKDRLKTAREAHRKAELERARRNLKRKEAQYKKKVQQAKKTKKGNDQKVALWRLKNWFNKHTDRLKKWIKKLEQKKQRQKLAPIDPNQWRVHKLVNRVNRVQAVPRSNYDFGLTKYGSKKDFQNFRNSQNQLWNNFPKALNTIKNPTYKEAQLIHLVKAKVNFLKDTYHNIIENNGFLANSRQGKLPVDLIKKFDDILDILKLAASPTTYKQVLEAYSVGDKKSQEKILFRRTLPENHAKNHPHAWGKAMYTKALYTMSYYYFNILGEYRVKLGNSINHMIHHGRHGKQLERWWIALRENLYTQIMAYYVAHPIRYIFVYYNQLDKKKNANQINAWRKKMQHEMNKFCPGKLNKKTLRNHVLHWALQTPGRARGRAKALVADVTNKTWADLQPVFRNWCNLGKVIKIRINRKGWKTYHFTNIISKLPKVHKAGYNFAIGSFANAAARRKFERNTKRFWFTFPKALQKAQHKKLSLHESEVIHHVQAKIGFIRSLARNVFNDNNILASTGHKKGPTHLTHKFDSIMSAFNVFSSPKTYNQLITAYDAAQSSGDTKMFSLTLPDKQAQGHPQAWSRAMYFKAFYGITAYDNLAFADYKDRLAAYLHHLYIHKAHHNHIRTWFATYESSVHAQFLIYYTYRVIEWVHKYYAGLNQKKTPAQIEAWKKHTQNLMNNNCPGKLKKADVHRGIWKFSGGSSLVRRHWRHRVGRISDRVWKDLQPIYKNWCNLEKIIG